MPKLSNMRFADYYSGDSSDTVEFMVEYDSEKTCIGSDEKGEITFQHIGEPVEFPADRIDWLIDALSRIRSEHESNV